VIAGATGPGKSVPAGPYAYFRLEVRELLEELKKSALVLDRGGPAAKSVGEMLRHAHTLKGAARVVRQPAIAEHAHAIEESLTLQRESVEELPKEVMNDVFRLLDDIENCIGLLPGPPSKNTPAQGPEQELPVRTFRTDVADMDLLLDGVGATHSLLSAMQTKLRNLAQVREIATQFGGQAPLQAKVGRVDPSQNEVGRTQTTSAEELLRAVSAFERGMGSDLDQLDRELSELRDQVERLKLVPARSLFSDLERVVRDAAQAQGKRVLFEARGGEIRLDAHVLGLAQGALQQMVRNAVVHGIEQPHERTANGKAIEGKVILEVARRGRSAVLTCSDDGRGIDMDAVRNVATKRGLLLDQTSLHDPSELMRLLLQGGISTSGSVTELSGRGIGLDVLRDFVSRVGGETTVTSSEGSGTSVQVSVPLSIGSFETLAVEVQGTEVLIPLDAIVQTGRLTSDEIRRSDNGRVLAHEGKVIPFIDLSDVLSDVADASPGEGPGPFVIIETRSGSAALGVTRLLGISEAVVRALPDFAHASEVVAGIWLDAEGNPRLVMAPEGLAATARQGDHSPRRTSEPTEERRKFPILVIDDSLTTRMLEQSILESANYDVDLACSAEEGLAKAKKNPYMLFLVDVEMPGMDGFGFIERTRADTVLREIPAVLVSSRSGPEDVRRGFDAGASAFVSKGEFDQGRLLEHIRELTRT